MTAIQLLEYSAAAVYLVIFFLVAGTAARRPTVANLAALLFFAAFAVVLIGGTLNDLGALPQVLDRLRGPVAMALPYLLLRLLNEFAGVPRAALRAAEAGLVLSAIALIVVPEQRPAQLTIVVIGYFATASLYAAGRFARASRRGHGVTRRRMEAAGAGIALIGLAALNAGVGTFTPLELDAVHSGVTSSLVLLAGFAFFVGFTPPAAVRRAWQEPELRAFLQRAASLPRLPDTASIVRELEAGAAASLGARATIGLWDEAERALCFEDPHGALPPRVTEGRFLAWRVFQSQHAAYYPDAASAHPEHAEAYARTGVRSVLIAPITAGERRLGVLEVYAARAPIFEDDDLALVQLLADQAAVILESRALIDEAARVRAQEEATRMKEDFLSAAAHDLKTPLTTLVAQAQFLERKSQRDPGAPADTAGLGRIVREAKRLADLVSELLDANRLEQGRLVGEREPTDIVERAREVAEAADPKRVNVEASAPVVGLFDPQRVSQLVANLIENALKYSASDAAVTVRVWQEGSTCRISVTDQGIGIPKEDVEHVFDRFRRASNVDDRRFSGMGLGLYICKGIVEQHGGRIWVESEIGKGSTFQVSLPEAALAADERVS